MRRPLVHRNVCNITVEDIPFGVATLTHGTKCVRDSADDAFDLRPLSQANLYWVAVAPRLFEQLPGRGRSPFWRHSFRCGIAMRLYQ